MIKRDRFKDAPWFIQEKEQKDFTAIIGGSGGIGTWLSLLLSRAGVPLVVFDDDIVESHNIGGQLFPKKHVGKAKVESLALTISEFSDMEITAFNQRVEKGTMSGPYVFAAFDNMKAREDLFNNWYKANKDNPDAILIDGRLLMEHMQILCVTPATAEKYKEKHLFKDEEVPTESCTLKQTSHSAAMIASLMVGFFTNHITNVKKGKKIRQVPFFYEYFIPVNLTTIENVSIKKERTVKS